VVKELRTLAEKVSPEHTALLIIDVQNDFCHPDGAIARMGQDTSYAREVVGPIVGLVESARQADLPVIFVRVSATPETDSPVWRLRGQGGSLLDPRAVPIVWEGTWGAEFYGVIPEPGDLVITKHRYSAFYGTKLEVVLRSRGIQTLILTGVQTNICVESTAREGMMRDYYIVIPSDCVATSSPADQEASLGNIRHAFGVVTTSSEIVQVWTGARTTQPVTR
jgi:ureidoacrylate peracid hydrolase